MLAIVLFLAPSCLALHHSPQLLRRSRVLQRSSSAPARMIALDPLVASDMSAKFDLPLLSGLQGKAMLVEKSDIPTKAQVRQAVPKHCFERDTAKSMMYAAISVAQSAACLVAARLLPMRWAASPLWLAWAAVTGTVWTGMWVVAHECGHGAFSDNRKLQDAVGYVLHSVLLVPYFSWQVLRHYSAVTLPLQCRYSAVTSRGSARTRCTTRTRTTSPRARRTCPSSSTAAPASRTRAARASSRTPSASARGRGGCSSWRHRLVS